MKRLVLLAACAALTGCDYTVPLFKAPSGDPDAALTGLWERTENGEKESLLVLPLGRQELLVAYPAASKETMYARAWTGRAGGMAMMQVQWIGNGKAARPDDGKAFQVAAWKIDGDKLTVRVVNGDVIGAGSTSTEALAKAFEAGKDRADAFRDVMIFMRVKE